MVDALRRARLATLFERVDAFAQLRMQLLHLDARVG